MQYYDPTKVTLTLNGEQVTSFAPDTKITYEKGDFYSENLNFRSSLILVGFEVLYDGEVPVFAFKFKEE